MTLLQEHNASLHIDLAKNLNDISGVLRPYEKYLSLSLTTQSSEDYLALISFFEQMGSLVKESSSFLDEH